MVHPYWPWEVGSCGDLHVHHACHGSSGYQRGQNSSTEADSGEKKILGNKVRRKDFSKTLLYCRGVFDLLEKPDWSLDRFHEGQFLVGLCVQYQRMELELLPTQPLVRDTLYPYGLYPELTGVDHLALGCKYCSKVHV